jgi:hypothetical protein
MIHCLPVNDEKEHQLSGECWCNPKVEWIDPETGLPYPNPNAPMVVHNSADCREIAEQGTGESLAPDKKWEVVIS